ncbi:hypothetical protein [Embleya sp. NPDC005971]
MIETGAARTRRRRAWWVVVAMVVAVGIAVGVIEARDTPARAVVAPVPGVRIDVRTLTVGSVSAVHGLYVARTPQEDRVILSHLTPGRPAAAEPGVDFARSAVVSISMGTRCAQTKSARLYLDGSALALDLETGPEQRECFDEMPLVARFEVPRDKLPAQPHFQGRKPRDPGTGLLVAQRVFDTPTQSPPPGVRSRELADAAELSGWSAELGLPRDAVPVLPPRTRDRRFAFAVPYCRTPAAAVEVGTRVDVGPDGVPALTLSEPPRGAAACRSAATMLVVYDVPVR